MAVNDNDVITLCDPPRMTSAMESRAKASGGVKMTIRIESEPLHHVFDPKTLGAPIAAAIASTFKRKMKEISAIAKPATLRMRKAAERAINHTAPEHKAMSKTAFAKKEAKEGRGHLLGPSGAWAVKRYSGGKMGPMAPNQSDRAFNDSGRFAESIATGWAEDAWRINVAANRLDETTTSGELGVRRIWNKLTQLVPAFGNPALLFDEPEVKQGLQDSLEQLIIKAEKTREQLTRARVMAKIAAVRQVIQAVLSLAA
jgi:hypothetical protein